MGSFSADDLDKMLKLNEQIDFEDLEALIDAAIDTLNLFGAAIDNLSGVAGEKTVTVTSKERGAVLQSARAVYYGFYVGIESGGMSDVSVSSFDLMSNAQVIAIIKEAAHRLEQHEGVPFVVGEATS